MLATACQTDIDTVTPANPETPQPGATTQVGKPIGPAATQTIGPAGGTLTSADGKLTLTFPKGAVPKDAPVTVQEVENTAPNGSGSSYVIDGLEITVSEPVIGVYREREREFSGLVQGNVAVARQGKGGDWKASNLATVDAVNRTITTRIRRIEKGAIAFIESTKLSPEKATLVPGEKLPLTLTRVELIALELEPGEEISVPFPQIPASTTVQKMLVNGSAEDRDFGVCEFQDPSERLARLQYTAPKRVPVKSRNPVAVQIELFNPAVKAYLALVANLTIVTPAEFSLGGRTFDDPVVFAMPAGPAMHIELRENANIRPGARPALLSVTFPFDGKPGTFTLTKDNATNWSASANESGEEDVWSKGASWPEAYGPITVTITEYGGSQKPLAGTISGTLHQGSGPDHKTITVKARFRVAQYM